MRKLKKREIKIISLILILSLLIGILYYLNVAQYEFYDVGEWQPATYDGYDLTINYNVGGLRYISNDAPLVEIRHPTNPLTNIKTKTACNEIGFSWEAITSTSGFCAWDSVWKYEDYDSFGTCRPSFDGTSLRLYPSYVSNPGRPPSVQSCSGKVIVHINQRPTEEPQISVYPEEQTEPIKEEPQIIVVDEPEEKTIVETIVEIFTPEEKPTQQVQTTTTTQEKPSMIYYAIATVLTILIILLIIFLIYRGVRR